MMNVTGTRFGEIELDDGKAIVFPRGLIGFPNALRYVLLEPRGTGQVAWLQSLDTPELAFPVIDGAAIGASYPDPAPAKLAHEAGIGGAEIAVLVIVAAQQGKGLVANLLAPLVIDLESRSGVQVVLDPNRYSAAVPVAGSKPAPTVHAP
jgi:flagellar assembly factor FliW